ncbi:thioredoxin [Blastocystis sp. subtype 4]|uniref:thioredoxin n=1 Tax=Blastocystis sp. subtype 4 TaxID=944170 RepID=UPI000711CFFB|nr:thioredoxin [Blastocystis sp. subtype 4]KNB46817.1 thioredoxin [Blastocystis sp. subtype 4]|eukprot:XP_014530260.1 thioredoxin [Blastocystis sp. subtype 4]
MKLYDLVMNEEVIQLNDDNFETLTQSTTGSTTGRWFVKFYAPWCGHCKKLAPIWEDLADDLKGEINVAEVDATANPVLSKLYEIEGFPTLYFFENGKYIAFEGTRDLETLKSFALEEHDPSSMEDCPRLPSFFSMKVQQLSELANRHLAQEPFTTCLVLMGAGAVVGASVTLLIFCFKRRKTYEPVTEEKKNN